MKTTTKFLTVCAMATAILPLAAADCLSASAVVPCTTDDDCAVDEVCDTTTSICVPAEGEGEGEGEACTDDDECFATDEACDEAGGACGDPDVTEGSCAAATDLGGSRDADGPIIYDVEFFADPDFDSDCEVLTAGSSAYSVFYFYYDPSGDAITDDGDAYGASQWAEAGGDALSFTLPVTIGSGPDEAAADGTAGSFYGTNCYLTAPDAVAVSIADQAGNSSNVGCPE